MTVDDRYLTWDAAYVLGALSTDDRLEYEDHLTGCTRCRTAVAELGGMPGLLGLLDLDDVNALDHEQPDPPLRPEVRESVLAKVRWRRRRTRWVNSAVIGLAAAVLAVGVLLVARPQIVGLQNRPDTQNTAMIEMNKVAPTPINASIALTDFGWGTRVDMVCTYGQWGDSTTAPKDLGMVVLTRDGNRSQIATWLGVPGATALPSGTTPIQRDDIAAVQMVSVSDGTVLLEKQL
ncbi:zf-HC2 domain-containing protein [Mycolicibacterium rufum]|uniref:Zf-HC2 domain-containing protein n=1 Tax=Mycolicibacterium rufum TaxID=318424 RepID=A0A9X2XX81_9MYCO|nr:zf-HC2 domain-containing protein [Mycolicibacterium rufum]KGI67035.1 anti-sigma factor [Mycolicibacterium rufum]MCV7070592.1 zf-HC2 domain-containing protein [Mycolicibacterium rufum]ULP37896.1 zf-HC2 domain-containing protein [Mycolicibacterium rufum]